MPHDSDLYKDLQKLRSRQGVDRPDLSGHLGPEIRRRCRLTGTERETQVRAAVETMLRTLIDSLSPYLREAALWAFALPREYRFPKLDDRVGKLAEVQRVSRRTARRRMDDALAAMAIAGEETAEPPTGAPAHRPAPAGGSRRCARCSGWTPRRRSSTRYARSWPPRRSMRPRYGSACPTPRTVCPT